MRPTQLRQCGSQPVSSNGVEPVIRPCWSAAVAVTSLKVEPGAYWPWVARLISGLLSLPLPVSWSYSSVEMPLTKSAGL